MAARRLVIVMLILLGVSTLAAVLVPTDPEERTTTEPTSTSRAGADRPRGELVRRTVNAAGRPEVVRMHAGDQLQLMVAVSRADEVEIGGLGELEEVDPSTPASFDLLLFEPGTHPIRLLDARRTIGRIVVRPRQAAKEKPGRRAT